MVNVAILEDGAALEPLEPLLDKYLAALAVIHGVTPGTIYVDDPRHPRAAMIQAHHRYHLAGDPGNTEFNQALHALMVDEIFPRSLAEGKEALGLYFTEGWQAPIREVILRGRDPIPGLRQVYETDFQSALPDWRADIPSGLRMAAVERALLEDPALENIGELVEELQSERESVDEFLAGSFGFCLRSDTEIVTWCLSEYNLGTRCEVGIATHPAYRRRGLAVLTGLAFLEAARQRGLTRVGWHCWANNHGSVATALRLGLRKVLDYPCFEVFFDPTVNLAVNGNICLDQQDYPSADAWLERALADPNAPAWAYVIAGCAAARLDDSPRALKRIAQAIERGYRLRSRLEENPHLASLRGLPEWQAMIGQLEE